MDFMKQLLYDLFLAYENAKRNKRSTSSVMEFEYDFESQLIQLAQDLYDRTYTISTSTYFIHQDRVVREIFAAHFRDRIVHHLRYRYVYPYIDPYFIHDSYSWRVGKGTSYWVSRASYFTRSCSSNYTTDCRILKLDIKSFFVSIHKDILRNQIQKLLSLVSHKIPCDMDRLSRLTHLLVYHDPTQNYHFIWDPSQRSLIPSYKSLFGASSTIWIPIGNLTSQVFANIMMNQLDQRIKNTMNIRYYGRYVDDMIILHRSKDFLLNLKWSIQYFLQSNFWLSLHPHKVYLQHYSKGVAFCGIMILPYRTYVLRRTIKKLHIVLHCLLAWYTYQKRIAVLNSYFGLLSHNHHYQLIQTLGQKFIYIYPSYRFHNGIVQSLTSL